MTHKSVLFLLLAAGVAGFLGVSVISAHAQAPGGGFGVGGGRGGGRMMGAGQVPGIAGKVTGVDTGAMTITVQGMRDSTTSYDVNVSNAVIKKNNATTTVSAILVGDTVMVRGKVSGSSVVATSVRDGAFGQGMGRQGNGSSTPEGMGRPWNGSGTPPYASGTRPMAPPTITGTIAGVNGSMLTVTGSNGTTYTVDASNATLIKKGSSASSISAINVGDSVQIEGNASGTSVTATTILDNVAQTSSSGSGFFGAIKSFLSNLFHFKF